MSICLKFIGSVHLIIRKLNHFKWGYALWFQGQKIDDTVDILNNIEKDYIIWFLTGGTISSTLYMLQIPNFQQIQKVWTGEFCSNLKAENLGVVYNDFFVVIFTNNVKGKMVIINKIDPSGHSKTMFVPFRFVAYYVLTLSIIIFWSCKQELKIDDVTQALE